MLICAAGDIHGAMECLYEDVLAFEQNLGARFDWVLHVGDFGIWPDPEEIDSGTRNRLPSGSSPCLSTKIKGCVMSSSGKSARLWPE